MSQDKPIMEAGVLLCFSIGRLFEDHDRMIKLMYDLRLLGQDFFPLDIYEETAVQPNSFLSPSLFMKWQQKSPQHQILM